MQTSVKFDESFNLSGYMTVFEFQDKVKFFSAPAKVCEVGAHT